MITSSQIAANEVQSDGRRYVTELHVTDEAAQPLLRYAYLALAGDDVTAIMNARASAYNAVQAAIPTVTVIMDDGTTATVKTDQFGNLDLRLTAAQKSALVTARNVIDAIRPLLRIYYSLTPAQQAFVLAHTPWWNGVLAVVNG